MFSSPCLRWLCTSIFEDALKYCETSSGRGISMVIISPSLLYQCFYVVHQVALYHMETNDLIVLSFQPSAMRLQLSIIVVKQSNPLYDGIYRHRLGIP